MLSIFEPLFQILISKVDIIFRGDFAIISSNLIVSYLCHEIADFRCSLMHLHDKIKSRNQIQFTYKLISFLPLLNHWFQNGLWDKNRKRVIWDLQMLINCLLAEVFVIIFSYL